MRYVLLTLVFTAAVVRGSSAQHTVDAARTVALRDSSGAERMLGEYLHGKTLLHVWGTWCSECLEAYPAYNRLVDSLSKDSIVAVNVAIEVNGFDHWRRVARRVGSGLQLYFDAENNPSPDSSGYLNLPWIRSIPACIAVGSKGRIVGEWYELPTRTDVITMLKPEIH